MIGSTLTLHTPWNVIMSFPLNISSLLPKIFPFWQLPNFSPCYQSSIPYHTSWFSKNRSCLYFLPLYHLFFQKPTLSFWFSFFLPETISTLKVSPQDTVFGWQQDNCKQKWHFSFRKCSNKLPCPQKTENITTFQEGKCMKVRAGP